MNNKEDNDILYMLEEKKKKKKEKQMTIGDNTTITRLHASRHVEEETVPHAARQRITRFSHQVMSCVPPE